MAAALRHPLSVRSLLGGDDDADPTPAPAAPAWADAPTPYVVATLVAWLRTQPHPRGRVAVADGVVRYTPPTGRPALSVVAPHPDDTHARTADTVDELLAAGLPAVWVLDARRRTVTAHRPDADPQFASRSQPVPEHPALPGFAPTAGELFE